MLKFVVATLCGISLSYSVYQAGWGMHGHDSHGAPATKHVAKTIPAGVVDMKNTKCLVLDMAMGDVGKGDLLFVTYQGKAYHICCEDCESIFNKEPEKYVKAFEADPAKFGVIKSDKPAAGAGEQKH
jgi:YHS domain-containing protein